MTRKQTGCFLIGATGPGVTTTGEALIGSVSDDPYDIRTYVRIVNPSGLHPHVGSELLSTTEHTLVERGYFVDPGETTRGVNQAGLAYTCAMVFRARGSRREGDRQHVRRIRAGPDDQVRDGRRRDRDVSIGPGHRRRLFLCS